MVCSGVNSSASLHARLVLKHTKAKVYAKMIRAIIETALRVKALQFQDKVVQMLRQDHRDKWVKEK